MVESNDFEKKKYREVVLTMFKEKVSPDLIGMMIKRVGYTSEEVEDMEWEAKPKSSVEEWYMEKQKGQLRDVLKEVFVSGASPDIIEEIKKVVHFTNKEIEEIRKEAESE